MNDAGTSLYYHSKKKSKDVEGTCTCIWRTHTSRACTSNHSLATTAQTWALSFSCVSSSWNACNLRACVVVLSDLIDVRVGQRTPAFSFTNTPRELALASFSIIYKEYAQDTGEGYTQRSVPLPPSVPLLRSLQPSHFVTPHPILLHRVHASSSVSFLVSSRFNVHTCFASSLDFIAKERREFEIWTQAIKVRQTGGRAERKKEREMVGVDTRE